MKALERRLSRLERLRDRKMADRIQSMTIDQVHAEIMKLWPRAMKDLSVFSPEELAMLQRTVVAIEASVGRDRSDLIRPSMAARIG